MSALDGRAPPAALVASIDAVLPQTQCAKCGYPGCEPYARALAAGQADIDLCAPGGEETIRQLAALTGRPARLPGMHHPPPGALRAALIDERHCIGCTLCIQACPVDAIVGAPRLMHTVIESLCTGCDLCLAPCPVDCIAMVTPSPPWSQWTAGRAAEARNRFQARQARLARNELPRAGRRQAVIQGAVARVRARRSALRSTPS